MSKLFYVSNKRVLIATAIALAINVSIYLIATGSGVSWEVGLSTPVTLLMVSFGTAVPMLIGAQIVLLASKWKQQAVGIFSWVVLIFAIAGAPGGYVASGSVATGLALGSMHVVVGIAWFISIRGAKKEERSRKPKQFLAVNTFHEGVGMKQIITKVLPERLKVNELRQQGSMGEVKLAIPQGKVFIDVFASTEEEAMETLKQLPMSQWWDIEMYELSGKV